MSLDNKFDQILKNYNDIETKLSSGNLDSKKYAQLSKEFSELTPLANKIKRVEKLSIELSDLDELLMSDDTEMIKVAKFEKEQLTNEVNKLNAEIKILLLPKEESDSKNAIVEIRAGTGGEEAALFAADLYRMYLRYSELHKWKYELIDISDTDHDGVKEVIINISGKNVFGTLTELSNIPNP